MKFFLSTPFALIVGLLSVVAIVGLMFMGHYVGMPADEATACFVGLISFILLCGFLVLSALAQNLTS